MHHCVVNTCMNKCKRKISFTENNTVPWREPFLTHSLSITSTCLDRHHTSPLPSIQGTTCLYNHTLSLAIHFEPDNEGTKFLWTSETSFLPHTTKTIKQNINIESPHKLKIRAEITWNAVTQDTFHQLTLTLPQSHWTAEWHCAPGLTLDAAEWTLSGSPCQHPGHLAGTGTHSAALRCSWTTKEDCLRHGHPWNCFHKQQTRNCSLGCSLSRRVDWIVMDGDSSFCFNSKELWCKGSFYNENISRTS